MRSSWLGFLVAAAAALALLVDCSSSTSNTEATDGGEDASVGDAQSEVSALDALGEGRPDSGDATATVDATDGASDSLPGDSGPDTGSDDSAAADAGSDDSAADADDAGSDDSAADVADAGSGDDSAADAADAGPWCSDAAPCTGGAACCSGQCVDTRRDPKNCGACGVACSGTQFCNGTTCNDTVLTNVCESPNATVTTDPWPDDGDAGVALARALSSGCSPGVAVRVVSQDADGILADSGKPITGVGDMLVAPGGGFGQRATRYMDIADTPVLVTGDDTTATFLVRKGGDTIVSFAVSTIAPGHDYFLVELVVEPTTGTPFLTVYGYYSFGTLAGAWYFENVIVPARATYTDAWYVYEWTDSDAVAGPSAGDTFTKIRSGR